jgi:quinol monooxygenase YgiN
MGKLAIVATIKTVPGKREEYLKHLKAHAQRCLATEPGTLKFDVLVPLDEADTVMLYEVYASPDAVEARWNGPSKWQAERSRSRDRRWYRSRQCEQGSCRPACRTAGLTSRPWACSAAKLRELECWAPEQAQPALSARPGSARRMGPPRPAGQP